MVACHSPYLGLPLMIRRNKKAIFEGIKNRLTKKLARWQEKLFSVGGNEVLIKAVVQVTPTYAMSLFWLPVGLCKDIKSITANFWWGTSKKKRNLHWRAWDTLVRAKKHRVMGFKDLIAFNKAMIRKQAWRIIQQPNPLMAKVLKGIYFPREDFLSSKLGYSLSYVWRSICWGKELIQGGSLGDWEMVNSYRSTMTNGYQDQTCLE